MVHRNRGSLIGILRHIAGGLLLLFGIAGVSPAQNPVPKINQPLVPDAAKPGGAAFTLTVNGFGFVSGAIVRWNGSARATTFVSRSKLTASIAASDIAKPTTASVTIVNPGPGGGASNVGFLVVMVPALALLGRADYAVGDGPNSLAVGDFNQDGKLDLVTSNYFVNTVSVLLGKGDGTFQPHVDYATELGPDTVVLGDFNRDGKLDLAVRNQSSNTVSVLLGKGDGTFRPAASFAVGVGQCCSRVAVGDFNGDGNLDLIASNHDDNTISVLLGIGDGTFRKQLVFPAGSGPAAIGVGDLNRDGKLDLVLANSNDVVSVLLGNGDGTFQSPVTYATASGPAWINIADLNGDGVPDLVVAASFAVSVLLGNGNGTFKPNTDFGVAAGSCRSELADLNGDGKLDLIVVPWNSSDVVSVLYGNGDGSFQPPVTFATGAMPEFVAVGDFNGKGMLSLAVADNNTPGEVSVLSGTGTLSPPGLHFGVELVGTQAAKVLTLTNLAASLSMTGIAIAGTNAGDFTQSNSCPSSLGPGAHCTINVTFKPTQLGPSTASLTVTDSGTGGSQSVPLTGFGGTNGPNATLSATTLAFGTQLLGIPSPAQSFTLSNYGLVALSIGSITVHGVDPGDFLQSHTCGTSLAPEASCTVSVTFKPTGVNARTASVSIADDATGSPQTVSLSGTSTEVELNPTSLNFRGIQVGSSLCMATTLSVGSTPLTITGITTNPGYFSQRNSCGSSVGAGKSCFINVCFYPPKTGTFTGTLSVSDNAGEQKVALSGSGCARVYNHKCLTPIVASPTVRSALVARSTVTVPRSTGSASVGTLVMDLADSTRDDPFLPDVTKRELLVRFWYPASTWENCTPADYTSPRVWSYFTSLTRLPLPAVTTNSCLNATVVDGVHPVVVFTPGYTGTFTDYTFLFEDLASRGYVVASIDHTYEATAVEFPNGRFVKSVLGSHLDNSWWTDDDTVSRALSVRLDDLTFVMNELERLNTSGDNPFAGKLDLTRVALAGHSLGGLTTWLGLQREPRFKAAVLLDPYLADIGSDPTDTPVLLMAMGRDKPSNQECRLWRDLQGPRFWVNLRGVEHVTPSDAVWLAKGAIQTGAMGPDKTIDALRSYVAAFLDTHLRAQPPDALLQGSSLEFPDVAVTTQDQQVCGQP
jgi:dienelactone hydrolase